MGPEHSVVSPVPEEHSERKQALNYLEMIREKKKKQSSVRYIDTFAQIFLREAKGAHK